MGRTPHTAPPLSLRQSNSDKEPSDRSETERKKQDKDKGKHPPFADSNTIAVKHALHVGDGKETPETERDSIVSEVSSEEAGDMLSVLPESPFSAGASMAASPPSARAPPRVTFVQDGQRPATAPEQSPTTPPLSGTGPFFSSGSAPPTAVSSPPLSTPNAGLSTSLPNSSSLPLSLSPPLFSAYSTATSPAPHPPDTLHTPHPPRTSRLGLTNTRGVGLPPLPSIRLLSTLSPELVAQVCKHEEYPQCH